MSLFGGDLTTPARVQTWLGGSGAVPLNMGQMVTSMSALIYNKLNRSRLFSQTHTRTFDGTGTYQLVLPDWPLVGTGAVSSVQLGARLIQPFPLPNPTTGAFPVNTFGYGYRFVPWEGNLPGSQAVLEFVNGVWYRGPQNLQVTYTAGYLIQNEAWAVPTPPTVTVSQPLGVWSRDNGVSYAAGQTRTGTLTVVTGVPAQGQYNAPVDSAPGTYTFSAADEGFSILISYSFVPADLEEACIQMVAERRSYATRIGELSKSLGGQEVVSFLRGSPHRRRMDSWFGLPPEIEALIMPYASVTSPAIGAPT